MMLKCIPLPVARRRCQLLDDRRDAIVVNTNAQEKAFAVRAAGRTFRYALPAGAVATFLWN